MKKDCVAVGLICLILAGLAGADYLATSISTDGSAMLATSGSDQNGSFVSRVMGVDAARLVRTVSGDDGVHDLVVSGSGPVLVSDFASTLLRNPEIRDRCIFLDAGSDRSLGEASVYTSGILQKGEYDASRAIGTDLSGETQVNGSGLLAFGSVGSGNRSLKTRGFVSGNLSVQDFFRYGGRV
ncbi:hypothetical protein [uncultured Methanospirillum sp.]|uniref:hypothetical protein n=1 Tax=uncultured Methanospirillum sp. TaxID=262503 RepID=UPI0029C6EBDE|nr:hypothetical protein [uncultured Methanospirillum sp.]